MGIEPLAAYRSYSDAWSAEVAAAERMRLLDAAWSEDGVFVDPENPEGLVGADALVGYIDATRAEMPGLVVTETSEPEILGERLRILWVAHQAGEQMYTGTDFVEFAGDGRISRLTMFYDSVPN